MPGAGVVSRGVEGYYLTGTEGAGEWTGAFANRGREANWLDGAAVVRDDRAERAPCPGRPHDRLRALVAALGQSTAQTLGTEGVL